MEIAAGILKNMSSSARPVVLCLACGEVTSRTSDRRNLRNSSSQHVIPLWKDLVAEELSKRNQHADLDDLVSGNSGYMCRKCFYAYEKYLKVKEELALKAIHAIDAVIPVTSTTSCSTSPSVRKRLPSSAIFPPPSKRMSSIQMPLVTASDSKSPDVAVIF